MSGLSVRDLECTRAGRPVFSAAAFELQPGELIHVKGANGSGKSSLLRLLCGLLPPSRGEIRWRDRPVVPGDADYARELAYMGHAGGMSGELTVMENLQFSLQMADSATSLSARREVLARMGLATCENDPLRRLSQGQRQRLALARVLLSERPLWLLDEPCTGLDEQAQALFEDALAGHLAQGGLAVLATHRDIGGTSPRAPTLDMDRLSDAGSRELPRRA